MHLNLIVLILFIVIFFSLLIAIIYKFTNKRAKHYNSVLIFSIGILVLLILSLFIYYGVENRVSHQVGNANQVGISKEAQDLLDQPSLLIQKMSFLGIGQGSTWNHTSNYEWHSISNEYQFGTKNKFEYEMNGIRYELKGNKNKCNKIALDLRIRNVKEKAQALLFLDSMAKKALYILSMNEIDTLHKSIMNAKEYQYTHQGLIIQLVHLPSRVEFWQLSISRYE